MYLRLEHTLFRVYLGAIGFSLKLYLHLSQDSLKLEDLPFGCNRVRFISCVKWKGAKKTRVQKLLSKRERSINNTILKNNYVNKIWLNLFFMDPSIIITLFSSHFAILFNTIPLWYYFSACLLIIIIFYFFMCNCSRGYFVGVEH